MCQVSYNNHHDGTWSAACDEHGVIQTEPSTKAVAQVVGFKHALENSELRDKGR